ncbi:hypothetical protein HMPREF1619_05895 [Klebsiella pneumoniae 909957]|nr:hypothetical protein HMPREF1619_05895 [Klebsiella pneumoniae 909957]
MDHIFNMLNHRERFPPSTIIEKPLTPDGRFPLCLITLAR